MPKPVLVDFFIATRCGVRAARQSRSDGTSGIAPPGPDRAYNEEHPASKDESGSLSGATGAVKEGRMPEWLQPRSKPGVTEMSAPRQSSPSRVFWLGLGVECGLGLCALLLARVFGISPLQKMVRSETLTELLREVGIGCLAVTPLLVILLLFERNGWASIRRLRTLVDDFVVPLFRGLSLAELAALSAAAGLGEELLFRGVIQDGLAAWIGGATGKAAAVVIASVLFGLCHFVSLEYFWVATVVGFYLGLLLNQLDSLIVPVVAHSGYDFLAFVYLLRVRRMARA